MDYNRIYNQLIDRAKTRILTTYVEKHHIIPRCFGGSNDKINIVELTAREHFIAHWLLFKMHKGTFEGYKMAAAFNMMSGKSKNHKERYNPLCSSRSYELARMEMSEYLKIHSPFFRPEVKEKLKDRKWTAEQKHKFSEYKKKNLSKRPPLTIEQREEARIRNTGILNPMYGKTISEEHKRIISEANKGKIVSDEFRKQMSIRKSGKNHHLFKGYPTIDGVIYENLQAVVDAGLAKTKQAARDRLTNKNYPTWTRTPVEGD